MNESITVVALKIGRKLILLFSLFLMMYACRGREVGIPMPDFSPKLVINGELRAGSPISLHVSHTVPAKGVIPSDVIVKDAVVRLFKNGMEIAKLEYSPANTNYYTDSMAAPGASYRIEIAAEGFLTARTPEVIVPSRIPKVDYRLTPHIEESSNAYWSKHQVEVIPDQSFEYGTGTLLIGFTAWCDTLHFDSARDMPGSLIASDSDCHIGSGNNISGIRRNFEIYDSRCLRLQKSIKVAVSVFKDDTGNRCSGRNVIEMQLGVVSADRMKYLQATYRQPEGLDHLVLPSQMAYSNIENGYGMVYAINSELIELK